MTHKEVEESLRNEETVDLQFFTIDGRTYMLSEEGEWVEISNGKKEEENLI